MTLKINENKVDIVNLNPVAKAILVFLLTRVGLVNYLKSTDVLKIDVYNERKRAVINILQSIQTKNEWKSIMLRVNADGSKVTEETKNYPEVIKGVEEKIIGFLQYGRDFDDELYEHKNKLLMREIDYSRYGFSKYDMSTVFFEIKSRIKLRPTRGYALTMNYQASYHLNQTDNPSYQRMCDYGASVCVG